MEMLETGAISELLIDNSRIRTHNYLVHKQTLNHLANLTKLASSAKWLSVRLPTKWLWVLLSLKSSDIAPVLSKEFLVGQATVECRFTLKCVRGMIIAYNQILIVEILKFHGIIKCQNIKQEIHFTQ